MVTYNDISPAQKRWVDLVEIFFPGVKSRGAVTYKEIHEIHDFFVSKRAEDKRFKVSMPIWLITANAMERGVYKFPASDAIPDDEPADIDTELEQIYLSELARYGITPKP